MGSGSFVYLNSTEHTSTEHLNLFTNYIPYNLRNTSSLSLTDLFFHYLSTLSTVQIHFIFMWVCVFVCVCLCEHVCTYMREPLCTYENIRAQRARILHSSRQCRIFLNSGNVTHRFNVSAVETSYIFDA